MGPSIILLALLIGVSSAKLAPLIMISPHGTEITDQYIVVFEDSSDVTADVASVSSITGVEIRHEYRNVFKGISVHLTNQEALTVIRGRSFVSYVEQDGEVTTQDMSMTWGLDRIDQRYLPLDGQLNFEGNSGEGVNAYIIDTGIFPGHDYFRGRAHVAFDAIGDGQEGIDCNGHGTHCAGTIGAEYYGIARGATLYGVRVLNCYGGGTLDGVIAGMDWVAANAILPAVASMSLGGGGSNALDLAVKRLYDDGVTVSVAAGNSNNDACLYSPARALEAITVAATTRDDYRAYFSSYGSCVDIFAPGLDVLSTLIGSHDATGIYSGTSMACPHVSGAAVVALGNDPTLTPKQVWEKLKADSTSGVLQDKGALSPDRMLYIPPASLQ